AEQRGEAVAPPGATAVKHPRLVIRVHPGIGPGAEEFQGHTLGGKLKMVHIVPEHGSISGSRRDRPGRERLLHNGPAAVQCYNAVSLLHTTGEKWLAVGCNLRHAFAMRREPKLKAGKL